MNSNANKAPSMINRKDNQNLSSNLQPVIRNKSPILITIKDKIIMSNTLNMVKTIAKVSPSILFRMMGDFLVFYTDIDCREKIRYVLKIPEDTRQIEVSRKEHLAIQINPYFAEALEWFLSEEDILKISIEPNLIKLISNKNNFEMEICRAPVESFQVYNSPDSIFNFGISSSNLERVLICEGDKSRCGWFSFDTVNTKFKTSAENSNVLKNDQVGIEVHTARFKDLCERLVVKRNLYDNLHQLESAEGLCIVFKVNRSFMDYFSVAPRFLKDKKKKDKNESAIYGNNQALQFGGKIYFSIKESYLNREDEGGKVIPAEIRMMAARKSNGVDIETFFFISDTEVHEEESKKVFEDHEVLKFSKPQGSLNLNDVSVFIEIATSQNIPQKSNDGVVIGSNLNNQGNRNKNNQSRSLLNQIKVEHDDNNNDNSNITNKTVSHAQNSKFNSSCNTTNRILSMKVDPEKENSIHDINTNENILGSINLSSHHFSLGNSDNIGINQPSNQFNLGINHSIIRNNESSFLSDPKSTKNVLNELNNVKNMNNNMMKKEEKKNPEICNFDLPVSNPLMLRNAFQGGIENQNKPPNPFLGGIQNQNMPPNPFLGGIQNQNNPPNPFLAGIQNQNNPPNPFLGGIQNQNNPPNPTKKPINVKDIPDFSKYIKKDEK